METFSDENERFSLPPVRPNASAAKTIGTLNIVFGCLLLLCGICTGLNLMMQSAMGPMIAAQQQHFQQAMQAERQQRLQELQQLAKEAKDEQEKAQLRAQHQALQAAPVPKMPDFARFAQDARLQTYFIVDIASGFVLNLLMVISGIGLVCLKDWGRQTAIWVAALKIIRLVGLYVYFTLAVVPVMVNGFTAMIEEMAAEMAKAAPPGQRMPAPADFAQMGTMLGAMMSGFAIGMIVVGVIYPTIVLIVLTRPRVKAACAPPAASRDYYP